MSRAASTNGGESSPRRHLVAPLNGVSSVTEVRRALQAAHDFLALAAREVVPRLQELPAVRWGSTAKRTKVRLNLIEPGQRPELVRGASDEHSFAEVMNQCATLERLLDALAWVADAESGLATCSVYACHPTTSSVKPKGNLRENDLVLKAGDGGVARFEVSDVASRKDGNRKLPAELRALGVVGEDGAVTFRAEERLFIVVSEEFAECVMGKKPKGYRFRSMTETGETRIFEILQST